MSCECYRVEGFEIRIPGEAEELNCLCTCGLKCNAGTRADVPYSVKSLAYIGAAVIMAKRERLEKGTCNYLPDCIPDSWRKIIDECFPDDKPACEAAT